MYQVYFKYNKDENSFIYIEGKTQFKMPLRLMLQLKKYLREVADLNSKDPIAKWYRALDEIDSKEVVLEKIQQEQ